MGNLIKLGTWLSFKTIFLCNVWKRSFIKKGRRLNDIKYWARVLLARVQIHNSGSDAYVPGNMDITSHCYVSHFVLGCADSAQVITIIVHKKLGGASREKGIGVVSS